MRCKGAAPTDILFSNNFKNERIKIPIRNVTLSKEIEAMIHNMDASNFLIQMKENTTCYEPYFFMRLSGSALLSPYHQKVSENTYIFPYELPIDGIFHLELLFFGCNYNLSTIENVASYCILPKEELILNELYQFTGVASLLGKKSTSWVLLEDERKNKSKAVNVRYQREKCFSKKKNISKKEQELCDDETDHSWKNHYFLNNSLSYKTVNQSFTIQYPFSSILWNITKICFVGGSHSKYHRIKAIEMQKHYHIFKNVYFKSIDIRAPIQRIWTQKSNQFNSSCDIAIVALGQWSAIIREGYSGFGVNQFYDGMENVILDFKNLPKTKFYLRTIHYNPLGYTKIACPADDFRVPYLIEGYNKALKTLSEKYKIPLIDTDWLIRPIWDSSSDYNHLLGSECFHEIIYMMSFICNNR